MYSWSLRREGNHAIIIRSQTRPYLFHIQEHDLITWRRPMWLLPSQLSTPNPIPSAIFSSSENVHSPISHSQFSTPNLIPFAIFTRFSESVHSTISPSPEVYLVDSCFFIFQQQGKSRFQSSPAPARMYTDQSLLVLKYPKLTYWSHTGTWRCFT